MLLPFKVNLFKVQSLGQQADVYTTSLPGKSATYSGTERYADKLNDFTKSFASFDEVARAYETVAKQGQTVALIDFVGSIDIATLLIEYITKLTTIKVLASS